MQVEYSIIVPVHNVSNYLDDCVQSILSQKIKDWELILVDDGSQDGSGLLCDNYAKMDSRISVIHQNNKGASEARNQGLMRAKGIWISFVDADDWISSDYLQIHQMKSKGEDLFLFTISQVFPDGNQLIRYPQAEYSNDREKIEQIIYDSTFGSVGDFFGYTVAKFFKNSIIKTHCLKFDSTLVFREDEIFTMEYCQYIHSIQTVKDTLYYYRFNPAGVTAKGIQVQDYKILSIHLSSILQYYSSPKLISIETSRINDYNIDYALKSCTIRNLISKSKTLYNSLSQVHHNESQIHKRFVSRIHHLFPLFLLEFVVYFVYKLAKGYMPCPKF